MNINFQFCTATGNYIPPIEFDAGKHTPEEWEALNEERKSMFQLHAQAFYKTENGDIKWWEADEENGEPVLVSQENLADRRKVFVERILGSMVTQLSDYWNLHGDGSWYLQDCESALLDISRFKGDPVKIANQVLGIKPEVVYPGPA